MSPTKDNPNHSQPPRNVSDVNHHRDRSDPIENLLEQIKTQHQTHPISPNTPPIDHDPFQHLRPQQQTQPNPDPDPIEQQLQQIKTQRSRPRPTPNPSNDPTNLLDQLKHRKQQQQPQTTPSSLRQNLDEIRLAEQRQQQQKKQAIAQAQNWLKQLDPYSDEGLWFDQFAESYNDRLDAAIEYLKALKSL